MSGKRLNIWCGVRLLNSGVELDKMLRFVCAPRDPPLTQAFSEVFKL